MKNYTYYNRILPEEECTTTENVKNSLLSQMVNAYESMKKHLDIESVEKVAEQLHNADKVRFYSAFQSSSIYSLQQNLAMSGVESAYYMLMPEIMEDSKQLTEKSVVFINTIEHAETMDLKAVFESIKKQGATVLGISTRKSKYKKYIDQEIMSEENGKIVEDLMMFDIYFYMLSESYRLKYI